jgi:hypothetical protein
MILAHEDATFWIALGSIATTAAVVVALFTPWVVERLRDRRERKQRPSLSLVFDPRTDAVIEKVRYSDQVEGSAAWIRVGVHAEADRRAARDVEVLLEKAQPLDSDEEVLIAWPAFQWTHLDAATRLTIPPGVTRYLDVATVFLRSDWEPKINLLIAAQPMDERNRLAPGKYELWLVASSRDAETRRYVLRIEWDGELGEEREDIWKHLKVMIAVSKD